MIVNTRHNTPEKQGLFDLIARLPQTVQRSLLQELQTYQAAPAASPGCAQSLRQTLATVLQIEEEKIDFKRSALDYGMDSISFMHWQNLWQKSTGDDPRKLDLSLQEALQSWLTALAQSSSHRTELSSGSSGMHWQETWFDTDTDTDTDAVAATHARLELALPQRLGRLLAQPLALRAENGRLCLRHQQPLSDEVQNLLAGAQQELITALGGREHYPAFAVQRRYWLLNEMGAAPALYTNWTGLSLQGELERDLLQNLCRQLIAGEKALRIVLQRLGQQIVQQVCSVEQAFYFRIEDVQSANPQAAQEQIRACVAQEMAIDKQNGPCVKFLLFKLAPHQHQFYVLIDHTICDAFAMHQVLHILLQSLAARSLQLPAVWGERSYLDKALLPTPAPQAASLNFWRTYLQDAPYNTPLPPASAPLSADSTHPYAGDSLSRMLPGLEQMRALAAQQGVTLFKLCSALIADELFAWSAQEELVLGFPLQCQSEISEAQMVGDYTNTLPLRLRRAGHSIAATGQEIDRVRQHAQVPFEQIANLIARRFEYENPLFNIMLNEQPPAPAWRQDGQENGLQIDLLPERNPCRLAKMALMFVWRQQGGELELVCEYRSRLFAAADIEALLAGIAARFQAAIAHHVPPQQTIPAKEAQPSVSLAASFSLEPMEKALQSWLDFLDWPWAIECADYNQVFQTLLDPGSLFARNRDGVKVLLLRRQDLGQHADELLGVLQSHLQQYRTPLILIFGAESTEQADSGMAQHWQQTLAAYPHCRFWSSAQIADLYPLPDFADPQRWELASIPYTDAYYQILAACTCRSLFALRYKAPKVFVLDCDNTLWQGVIGEDGMQGIRFSAANLALQQRMLSLQAAGALLCLCSKNDEADVLQVLRRHPQMLIRESQLVAWKINWHSKGENIAQLAAELNLGLDSFVFIDDNPLEISTVHSVCPAVTCLRFPPQETAGPEWVRQHWLLDVPPHSTAEDGQRTQMYQQNLQRRQLEQEFVQHPGAAGQALQDFLQQLQLHIEIAPLQAAQLERVAQLMLRTNQFNTTTRRRSAAEIEAYVAQGGLVRTVQVQDRFGDYGLVAVLLYRITAQACVLDDFLMSCRVLGRGVEQHLLSFTAQQALAAGKAEVQIAYRASAKNKPVQILLQQQLQPLRTGHEGDTELLCYPAQELAQLHAQILTAPATTAKDSDSDSAAAPVLQSEYGADLLHKLEQLQQAGAHFHTQALLPARLQTRLAAQLDQYLQEAPQGQTLCISSEEMAAFARASGDHNPLHTDARYAAGTGFGWPVVFGALGAWRALQSVAGIWQAACAAGLRWHLQLQFHHALLPGITYQICRRNVSAQELHVEICDGGKVMSSIHARAHAANVQTEELQAARTEAETQRTSAALRSEQELQALQAFAGQIALQGRWQPGQADDCSASLPELGQLLMCASYLVGMEWPGRQALFSALDLQCGPSLPSLPTAGTGAPEWRYQLQAQHYDSGSGLLAYRARLVCGDQVLAEAGIKAFARKILPALQTLPQPISGTHLAGKTVLISGGSRGLGAALVLHLAAAGARVWLNYRHGRQEAQALQALAPQHINLLEGDISAFETLLAQMPVLPDLLILNAAPPTLELAPCRSNRAPISAYVQQSLACMQQAAAVYLRQVQEQGKGKVGKLVYISSIYAAHDLGSEQRFFPYVLAKQSAEYYLQALAKHWPQADILLLRPERIATAMANKSNFSLLNSMPAEQAAAAILPLLQAGRGLRIEMVRGPKSDTVQQVQNTPGGPAPQASPRARTDLAQQLHSIFVQALENEQARPELDFFAQGGSSMHLVELMTQIRHKLGVSLDYADLPREISVPTLLPLLQPRLVPQDMSPAPALAERVARPAASPYGQALAIVGLAAEFPGSSDLAQFWQGIANGESRIRPLPGQHPAHLPQTAQRHTYSASLLEESMRFDADFFQISSVEAQAMPPHLRRLLQQSWNCLQEAGFYPGHPDLQETGVFVACNVEAYSAQLAASLDAQLSSAAWLSRLQGMTPNFVANYLSHQMQLSGPSEVISSTCSSFLVALHRAASAIANGDCAQALVGAANVLLDPLSLRALEKLGLFSANGKVASFQDGAQGTVPGEGVGAILLMPLERAQELGAHVHAVLAGSASGHGGRGASPVAPNPAAQARLLQQACRRAGCTESELDYLELHGLGAQFADSAEMQGLELSFAGQPRPLALSCLKPLLGHTLEASGLAALCKVVAAFKARTLPAMPGATQIQSQWRNWPFLAQAAAWPLRGTARRAAINSFGLSAVYACAVLMEAPLPQTTEPAEPVPEHATPLPLPLSAANPAALRRQAALLLQHLQNLPPQAQPGLADLAFTLQQGRAQLASRCLYFARDLAQLMDLLQQSVDQEQDCAGQVFYTKHDAEDGAMPDLLPAPALQAWLQTRADGEAGPQLDWGKLAPADEGARRLSLPAYPFQGRAWPLPGKALQPVPQEAQPAQEQEAQRRLLQRFRHGQINQDTCAQALLALLQNPTPPGTKTGTHDDQESV